jgi:hypothetical protein
MVMPISSCKYDLSTSKFKHRDIEIVALTLEQANSPDKIGADLGNQPRQEKRLREI